MSKALLIKLLVPVVFTIASLEFAGLCATFLAPKLFRQSSSVAAAIDAIPAPDFDKFKISARLTPSIWQPPTSTTVSSRNCLGQVNTENYGAHTERTYSGYRSESVKTLLIGDSYTHGAEVGDNETIAGQLGSRFGVVTANLGVGGYSPVQALLRAQSLRAAFPEPKSIILGIMYENIRRIPNGYGVAFSNDASALLSVRPFALGKSIVTVPEQAFETREAFKKYALHLLETDFWSAPEPSFPYSASVYRLLSSNAFQNRIKSYVHKFQGRQYETDYSNAVMSQSLATTISRYFSWSKSVGLDPIVVFIPQNKLDVKTAANWILKNKDKIEGEGRMYSAEWSDINWSEYNLKPNGDCHPSPYGYGKIAEFYASILKEPSHR